MRNAAPSPSQKTIVQDRNRGGEWSAHVIGIATRQTENGSLRFSRAVVILRVQGNGRARLTCRNNDLPELVEVTKQKIVASECSRAPHDKVDLNFFGRRG